MKKRILAWTLLAALLLTCIPLSQSAEASESIETGYANVLYNSVNGLPTSEANDVAQTPDGFVWVGSYSGLIRYDGKVFKRMDASTGINNVNVLYVDGGGRLWIGTNDGGAAVYENGSFTFYSKKDGLQSNSVRCFAEDARGNLFIGTTDGLSYVSTTDRVLRPINDGELPSRYINDLAVDSTGRVYGVTSLGDIFTVRAFTVDQTVAYDENRSSMPLCIFIDSADQIFIGTDGSKVLRASIAGGQLQFTEMDCGTLTNLNCIRKLGGRLWVCADNGVGYFEGDAPFHVLGDLPLSNSIDRIYSDYEGNFWLASSRQGVLKITRNRFADISRAAGLPECVVNSTMLRDGLLYVATDKQLYILDANTYQPVENELTKMLAGIRVRCITKDRDNNLWFSTYEKYGLVKYDTQGAITTFTSADGLTSSRVRSAIQVQDGSIVAATSNGVNVIRDGKLVQTYGEKDGLRNLEILTLCQGPDGTGYIGTDGSGLYIFRNGKISGRLSQEDGLRSDIILRVKYDPDYHGIWIVTGNSIAFYDGEEVRNITQFPYPNNFDLFLTENDGIWILSSNGIYVTTRTSLFSNREISYRFYNYEDGLPSNITANSFSYADENGTIYLCGSSGVFSTSLRQDEAYTSKPRIAIPDVTADQSTLPVGQNGGVTVGSDVSRVTINAYVLFYALHDPLVRYRLVGFDKAPITVNKSELGEISYTNLKGGDYTFEISVLDENTGDTLSTAKLALKKTPTFRETPLYPLLLALLVVGITALLFYFAFRIRMKGILKKHEETEAFMKQVIHAFAKAIDAKDKYTNGHSLRVASYSRMLAEELGMDKNSVEDVFNTALLHDIGKIAVPDAILNKPGPLTDGEFAVMKKHTTVGGEILAEITAAPKMGEGAACHHERYDGSGYPAALAGEQIPFVARIISVADAFDAMNSKRPYRDPLSREKIVSELKRCSGRQFDPQVAEAMLRLIETGKVVIGSQPTDEKS